MKDLEEFKEIEDEEDRKSGFEKYVKRQKVSFPLILSTKITFLVIIFNPPH
jgi:hypothetical protein